MIKDARLEAWRILRRRVRTSITCSFVVLVLAICAAVESAFYGVAAGIVHVLACLASAAFVAFIVTVDLASTGADVERLYSREPKQ